MIFRTKVKNMFSPAMWIKGFMLTKFGKRIAQFGAAALVGLVTTPKIADGLTHYGITFKMDKDVLADALAVLIVGLLGGIFNTAKHGPLKDEPGQK
jgi:hypothetical protein